MRRGELPDDVLQRRAIIYVRQSTGAEVQENLESQRRQYELKDLAQAYGFHDVVTLDASRRDAPEFRCGNESVRCLGSGRARQAGAQWGAAAWLAVG